MTRRIVLIQGHPDGGARHFDHALADAYAEGAAAAGHELRVIQVAALDFPLLRSKADWDDGALPEGLREAQQAIGWAGHLVIFHPLWLGTMPALLKGFLEQVLRPGFASVRADTRSGWKPGLAGKSARVVITMGMPAFAYRWLYGAHSLKNLKRNILGFCGVRPVRASLIGMVEAGGPARHARWLEKMRALGRAGR